MTVQPHQPPQPVLPAQTRPRGLLDRQRSLAEAGRIRIGITAPTRDGSDTRPTKLTTFRFTSPDRRKIETLAGLYGGTVEPWTAERGRAGAHEWQVVTNTAEIPVRLVKNYPIQQAYELWGGKGRVRECDGETEFLSSRPGQPTSCLCRRVDGGDLRLRAENAAQRTPTACKPTTRLSVMLEDVPGIGRWVLVTRGSIAADELAGVAEVLYAFESADRRIPAVLRLTQRQAGDKTFGVPVLEIASTVAEIEAGIAPQAPGGALTTGRQAIEGPAAPAPAEDEVHEGVVVPPHEGPTAAAPAHPNAPEWLKAEDPDDLARLIREARTAEDVQWCGWLARNRGWLGEYVPESARKGAPLVAMENLLWDRVQEFTGPEGP